MAEHRTLFSSQGWLISPISFPVCFSFACFKHCYFLCLNGVLLQKYVQNIIIQISWAFWAILSKITSQNFGISKTILPFPYGKNLYFGLFAIKEGVLFYRLSLKEMGLASKVQILSEGFCVHFMVIPLLSVIENGVVTQDQILDKTIFLFAFSSIFQLWVNRRI